MADNGRAAGVLTNWQARFVAALLEAPTVADAAAAAGIGERTAYRYLDDPAVKGELQARHDAMIGAAARRLSHEMDVALDVLHEIMVDAASPPTPRVSAARAVLDAGLRYAELVSLAGRVSALEEKVAERE